MTANGHSETPFITPADALLIIDMQVDFMPGGELGVAGADGVVPLINRLSELPFGLIAATQDWHPSDHVSFDMQGGPWPEHCVAGTKGAALVPDLAQAHIGVVLRKGMRPDTDSYSAFEDNARTSRTGLDGLLRGRGINRVFVVGVALDYCVAATARDAVRAGFATVVLTDACRSVAQSVAAMQAGLVSEGVETAHAVDLLALMDRALTPREIADQLEALLAGRSYVQAIATRALKIFNSHDRPRFKALSDALMELVTMDAEPEFELDRNAILAIIDTIRSL
ncbi:nicotinamidase [Komagataeibacter sp. AV436]|uniref:nicotinamidase n=1 Tax=Komagataeibacter melomenusus TaxID=2766578 RepID=A0ABX2A954_9PROT|nr:nicotinamidase [Komagataeibacter melomenusus]MBV1829408.1 nicotinamidase [Komagataeibacter melomenusus]NPC64979.1 nicotinamidase [Komagataeibacter melomenusus]